jgi:hypothetical protein
MFCIDRGIAVVVVRRLRWRWRRRKPKLLWFVCCVLVRRAAAGTTTRLSSRDKVFNKTGAQTRRRESTHATILKKN